MTRKIALSVLCLLLTVLALFSGWKIYSELSARQREKDEFSDLAALVEPPTTKPPTAAVPEETTAPEESAEPVAELRDLTELFAQNQDCIGWLCVPGTQIDYPVMFTPEEPQRYLRRSFYGAYSQSGVPFLDFRCNENSNLILYGHNMRNGTMFGNLTGYTDANFAAEHPVIDLQTAAGLSRYTVSPWLRCKRQIHGMILLRQTTVRNLMNRLRICCAKPAIRPASFRLTVSSFSPYPPAMAAEIAG